jgi:hypothetical protein
LRQEHVICIEKSNITACGLFQAEIARRTFATIAVTRMFKIPYLFGIAIAIFFGDCCTSIYRAVVHQQQLPITVCLRQNAIYGFRQKCLSIEENHNN